MKGFILKEFLLLKKGMGPYFAFLMVAALFFSITAGVSATASMIPFFFSILIISTFSYDDMARWDPFAVSTPVSRKRIVNAKYITACLFSLLGALTSCLISLVVLLIQKQSWTFEITLCILVAMGSSLLLNAVMIPLIYRFGAEKARLFLILLVFIPIGLGILAQNMGFQISVGQETVVSLMAFSPVLASLLLIPSCMISQRIYINKEF